MSPLPGDHYFSQAKTHLDNIIHFKFVKVTVMQVVPAERDEKYDTLHGMVEILEFGPTYKMIINAYMIKNGFGYLMEKELSQVSKEYVKEFADDYEKAKEEKKGLWGDGSDREMVESTAKQGGFGGMSDIIKAHEVRDGTPGESSNNNGNKGPKKVESILDDDL